MGDIKPALTAEEWEHKEFAIGERDTLFGYIKSETGKLHLAWNGNISLPVEDNLPLAALALYGQPFGFTREDVEVLRQVARGDWGMEAPDPITMSIADRIEALLPPAPPTEGSVTSKKRTA